MLIHIDGLNMRTTICISLGFKKIKINNKNKTSLQTHSDTGQYYKWTIWNKNKLSKFCPLDGDKDQDKMSLFLLLLYVLLVAFKKEMRDGSCCTFLFICLKHEWRPENSPFNKIKTLHWDWCYCPSSLAVVAKSMFLLVIIGRINSPVVSLG